MAEDVKLFQTQMVLNSSVGFLLELSPSLFTVFTALLADVFHNGKVGISIKYRMDDSMYQSIRTINTKKTEVMNQATPQGTFQYHQGERALFTYRGSTLSRPVNIDAEVKNRIAKAASLAQVFGGLSTNISSLGAQGNQHNIKM